MTAETIRTPVTGSASAPGGASHQPTRVEIRNRRPARRVRALLGWLVLAAAVVLAWPAVWGGWTGVTIVVGQSMEPSYETGDVVLTWKQDAYQVGDVLSYVVPDGQAGAGGHVIHRVLSVDASSGEEIYTTIGDNNPSADPWEIRADDILGKARFHVPGAAGWVDASVLPYVLAAAAGGIVTVLLWSGRSEDEENGENDNQNAHEDDHDAA